MTCGLSNPHEGQKPGTGWIRMVPKVIAGLEVHPPVISGNFIGNLTHPQLSSHFYRLVVKGT